MNRLSAVLAIAAVLVAARFCAAARGQTSTAPTQIYCPVTTDEKIDPDIFTDYQGKRIYFCCARCRTRFLREPATYLARLVGGDRESTPQTTADSGSAEAHWHVRADEPTSSTAESPHDGHERANRPEHMRGEHVHEHDQTGEGGFGSRLLKWLGGFHPAMVNFPIGVLGAGALAEILFIVRRREAFSHAARFCTSFAAITGVAAALLGWLFGGIHLVDSNALLATHRWLGTGTALWLIALLWSSERAHRQASARQLYRALLFGGTMLVLATGFFGGAMVYGLDHYLLH